MRQTENNNKTTLDLNGQIQHLKEQKDAAYIRNYVCHFNRVYTFWFYMMKKTIGLEKIKKQKNRKVERRSYMIGYDEKAKTYFVQVKYKDAITGKWRAKKKRGFEKKREAKLYEAELMQEIQHPADMTFLDVAHQWEDYMQTSVAQRNRHQIAFEKRFAALKDKSIEDITKQQLISWRNELASRDDCGTKIKNDTIAHVKAVFKYYSTIYNTIDIGSILKPLKKQEAEIMKEMEVWTVEEFNQFIEWVDEPIYKLFFETLFWTGARRGEILALQKVDFDGELINIHGSIRDFKNGIKPTKTKQSRRVWIDDSLRGKLKILADSNDGTFLFGGERSLSVSQIARVFEKGIKKSGVKRIRLHDLRHSHATLLINNGVNIVAVSKRLGHTSIEQTLKTYTHLLKDTDQQLNFTLNSIKNGAKLVPKQ